MKELAWIPSRILTPLTDLVIVGDNVFIPGKLSTLATLKQFAELATILRLKSQVELRKHHRIVVNLMTRTLHNFDSSVPNSCKMIGLTGNLKHQMEVMMISLGGNLGQVSSGHDSIWAGELPGRLEAMLWLREPHFFITGVLGRSVIFFVH